MDRLPRRNSDRGIGLRLLPRDMAQFGLLYLQRGQWHGTQIVPEAWVKASLTKQTQVSDRRFGFQNLVGRYLSTARNPCLNTKAGCPWSDGQALLMSDLHYSAALSVSAYKSDWPCCWRMARLCPNHR
jgi:CubicO group peptidase (beta-lactamase class C family)